MKTILILLAVYLLIKIAKRKVVEKARQMYEQDKKNA